MKNLFLIDGAAGTGKSDLIQFVARQLRNRKTCILRKMTTRSQRLAEERAAKPLDLEFVSEAKFAKVCAAGESYSYSYPQKGDGHRYGFTKKSLVEHFKHHDNVFVIVRNSLVIMELQEDFPEVNVVPVFVYVRPDTILKRLKAEGFPDDEIQLRLARSEEAMEDYYTHPLLYRHVLINNSSETVYQRQLQVIFKVHTDETDETLQISARDHYHLPPMLCKHKKAMVDCLSNYPYHKNVFVMMRFNEDADDLFTLICKSIGTDTRGLHCVRADMPKWSITKLDVSNPYAVLLCCKYGIALFDSKTERDGNFSVNVAMESAIMRMLGRQCLMLIKEELGPPPFDLDGIIYKSYSREAEIPKLVDEWLAQLPHES